MVWHGLRSSWSLTRGSRGVSFCISSPSHQTSWGHFSLVLWRTFVAVAFSIFVHRRSHQKAAHSFFWTVVFVYKRDCTRRSKKQNTLKIKSWTMTSIQILTIHSKSRLEASKECEGRGEDVLFCLFFQRWVSALIAPNHWRLENIKCFADIKSWANENTSGLPKIGDDEGRAFTLDKGDGWQKCVLNTNLDLFVI